MSFFDNYKPAKADPIFGLNAEIKADTRPHKIDLLIGYYKDEHNRVPIFKSVQQAQKHLQQTQTDLHYLPIDGHKPYIEALKHLIFDNYAPSTYGAQTVGGTSALYHLGKLLNLKGIVTVAIPDPTWANHSQIFQDIGMNVVYYPYYNMNNHTLKWDELYAFLHTLPKRSCVLLHASCHNPSGLDFNLEQWKQLAAICQSKQLFPFFDCAYQGLGGGLKEDVASIHLFCEQVDEFFLAYSCSKNFGLYGERTGALFYYTKKPAYQEVVASLIKQNIRATYSNPPRQGALIVAHILNHPELKTVWMDELNLYKQRVHHYRSRYQKALEQTLNQDLSYISKGRGLFIFTGLSPEKVNDLKEKKAIYLSSDGRLNLTGLNESNFDHIVSCLLNYLT